MIIALTEKNKVQIDSNDFILKLVQDANHDDLHLEMPTFPSNNFQLLKSLIILTQQMRQPHLCYIPKRPNYNPNQPSTQPITPSLSKKSTQFEILH